MIEAGQVLQNRYRVQKQIGQGGMGAVYIATDERFGSVVAIKETLVLENNYRKAIEREARLLNSLKHPALPRVSDHFNDEDGQFIVMEYIPGEDLSEIMERDNRAFPVNDVLTWADQLLDALDFLHNQEIPVIHRDIKPQNLKLTPRGQIILLDFGLAKGNPTDLEHQTAAKSIFGYSRNYASLEQIQGTGTDPRSDLYSLAATLYHLFTGTAPEDALTRAMNVLSEKDDTLILASDINPQIPRGVAVVLQKAMALNSNQRPISASEMREMLDKHEKFAFSDEIKVFSANPFKTEILNQDTKLMSETESQHNLSDSEQKTAVFSDVNLSQVTSIKNTSPKPLYGENATKLYDSATNESPKVNRKKLFAAAALGSLLLIGSAVGGVYLLNPFGANVKQENNISSDKLQLAPETKTDANAVAATANENTATENVASNSAETSVAEKSVSNDPNDTKNVGDAKTKIAVAPKSDEETLKSLEKQLENLDIEKIVVDGETVKIGNLKITEDGIETPDSIIDDQGVRRKNSNLQRRNPNRNPNMVPMPPIPPEALQNMTPEQRQKLKQIRQRQLQKQRQQQENPPSEPDQP